MALDSNILAIQGFPVWIPTEPLAKWNDLSNLHLVRKSTIFHLNRRAKRNHFRSCDFNRLISQPEGSQGFTFPRQHWSEPLKKRSSGVCKGNFVLIVETNAVQPALCSPWVTVSIKAAGSILLSNTGRRWGEKHHELVSAERERERTLGIINSNRPMTVNRAESVWAAFYFNHPPISPTSSHSPSTPVSYEICTRQTEVGLMRRPSSSMTNRYTSSTITYL